MMQHPRELVIPPSGYVARYGDRWPTNKAKSRSKQANRQRAWREDE